LTFSRGKADTIRESQPDPNRENRTFLLWLDKAKRDLPAFTFDLFYWDESLDWARGRRRCPRAPAGALKHLIPLCFCKSEGKKKRRLTNLGEKV